MTDAPLCQCGKRWDSEVHERDHDYKPSPAPSASAGAKCEKCGGAMVLQPLGVYLCGPCGWSPDLDPAPPREACAQEAITWIEDVMDNAEYAWTPLGEERFANVLASLRSLAEAEAEVAVRTDEAIGLSGQLAEARRENEALQVKLDIASAAHRNQINSTFKYISQRDALTERLAAVERDAERLREKLRGGRQKLATYQSVYQGDKELRRLLSEWDAALSTPPLNTLEAARRNNLDDTSYPPTSAEINSLPPNLRRWIAELETDADPAGTIRKAALVGEENSQLRALVAEQKTGNAMLVKALGECEVYFEEREDVIDGAYGEPAPNREMTLLIEIRDALSTPPRENPESGVTTCLWPQCGCEEKLRCQRGLR